LVMHSGLPHGHGQKFWGKGAKTQINTDVK